VVCLYMRGKKTSPELIYKVMVSYAITRNNMETSRQLGIPESTVRKIVEDNKNSEEFVKLCEEKQDEFAEKTSKLIDKLLDRLDDELNAEDKDIPINHITTAIGTLFDKRALSKGEMTQNVGFATNISLDKLAEISGFAKKDADE
jgi:hypothetical protein